MLGWLVVLCIDCWLGFGWVWFGVLGWIRWAGYGLFASSSSLGLRMGCLDGFGDGDLVWVAGWVWWFGVIWPLGCVFTILLCVVGILVLVVWVVGCWCLVFGLVFWVWMIVGWSVNFRSRGVSILVMFVVILESCWTVSVWIWLSGVGVWVV